LLDVFFADADAGVSRRARHELGAPARELSPLRRRLRPFELKEEGFRLLDRAIDRCARYGLYTIIDLHALPGSQNQRWHSDNPTHRAFFWDYRHFQDRVIHLWEAFARRYRHQPWVAGYNPINEPGDASGKAIARSTGACTTPCARSIPITSCSSRATANSVDFDVFGEPWPNTVYTVHDYALPGLYDGGDYPGVSRGRHVDRDVLEQTFRARTEYMQRTGTPIWVGEFGPVYPGGARENAMRLQVLADQLEIYHRPATPAGRCGRTRTSGCRGSCTPRPTHRTCASCAPCWRGRPGSERTRGARRMPACATSWIRSKRPSARVPRLRPLPLRPALVDPRPGPPRAPGRAAAGRVLGRCFEGLGPDGITALADSFRFTNCVKREPLLDVLRAALR
jgi:hypothetical protein